jgi:hypothetical protein
MVNPAKDCPGKSFEDEALKQVSPELVYVEGAGLDVEFAKF